MKRGSQWDSHLFLAPASANDLPGRKPGTSTKVMSGMLNASQNRTKRAPFTEELISKHPRREKLSMLSCWAIPSSTLWECALCNCLRADIYRGTIISSSENGKGELSHARKNRADKKTHLALAEEGLGVASVLGAQLVQTIRRCLTLKDYCHLRPSLVYPRGLQWEVSLRSWS